MVKDAQWFALNLNDQPGTQVCTIDVDGVVSNGQKSIAVAVGTEQNSEVKFWKVETTIRVFHKIDSRFSILKCKISNYKANFKCEYLTVISIWKNLKHFSLLESWLDRLNALILSSDHQHSTAKATTEELDAMIFHQH